MKQDDLISGYSHLYGSDISTSPIDYLDSKIRFTVDRCAGKRVLDIGCVEHDLAAFHGKHFLHRAIAGRAAETVGLDLHAEGVEHLRGLGYNVVVGDAENFAFEQPFDVIVAGDIIEHLGNLDGFLTSCLANLTPGGLIIVHSPNPWYWRNTVKALLYREAPTNPEHTCWFCPRTWRQLVGRYGLTLGAVEFGSRFARDRYMPLPRGFRHTSWYAETVRA